MTAKFGPAGNSEKFYDEGYKSSIHMPEWLAKNGADIYEYPCSRGVKISVENAKKLGENAKKYGTLISVHAPYYINFGSQDDDIIDKSIKYLVDTVQAAWYMRADRVVFHPGSCGKVDRELAFNTAKKTIKKTIDILKDMNLYPDVIVCPETMGKKNQLGTVDEIIELCSIDDRMIPTVDFGHVNAMGNGVLSSQEAFEALIFKIKDKLGYERVRNLHCHFSRIEYTQAGEKKHWSLKDTQYGPEFIHLAETIVKMDLSPRIICESRDTMFEDALLMKKMYTDILKTNTFI